MDNRRIERAPTRQQNCEPLDVVRNGGAAAGGAGCGKYVGGVSPRRVGARVSTPAGLVPLAGNAAVHEPAEPAARGATDAAGHAALPPPGAAHLAVLRDLRRTRGPVVTAGSFSRRAASRGGAPHVADEHRLAPAGYRVGVRPRVCGR